MNAELKFTTMRDCQCQLTLTVIKLEKNMVILRLAVVATSANVIMPMSLIAIKLKETSAANSDEG